MRSSLLRLFTLLLVWAPALTAADTPPGDERVQWQPWDAALPGRAHAAGRGVYLFVGDPLSALTRTTEAEIFSRPETVAWLNENFLCVRVETDRQPDLAAHARHFLSSVKQARGWPAHLWLAPDLAPYEGASYLPPSDQWGRPGFLTIARQALELWQDDPAAARARAAEAADQMRLLSAPALPPDAAARLTRAAEAWLATADPVHGGFGSGPKQPEPELLRLLLSRGGAARTAAVAAARALAAGALRDPQDGGFFRRVTDEAGREPFRQKTLSDQARFAWALSDAADALASDGGAPAAGTELRAAARGALEFALAGLRRPDGTFAAAWDDTQRPAAAQFPGTASPGTEGLLLAALARSDAARLRTAAGELAARWRARSAEARLTAADLTGLALGFRALGDTATAERLLARARDEFFSAEAGVFLAAPVPGFPGGRVPALDDPLPAGVLALLAGIEPGTAGPLRRALFAEIEYAEQPPGETLLALAAAEAGVINPAPD